MPVLIDSTAQVWASRCFASHKWRRAPELQKLQTWRPVSQRASPAPLPPLSIRCDA